QRLAASGSRAVARPDLQIVRKLQELPGRCIEPSSGGVLLPFDPGRRFEEIRSTDVSHEDEVARHRPDRLHRSRSAIGYEKTEVLRGVTRRVQRGNLDVADAEGIPILQICNGIVALT